MGSSSGSSGSGEAPAPDDDRAGASPSRLIGVALGVGLVALCLAAAMGGGWGSTTSEEVLASRFTCSQLPEDLTLDPAAYELPGGERVVRFFRQGAGDMDASLGAAGLAPWSRPASKGEDVDWSELRPTSQETPPGVLYLVRYPESAGEAVMREQFRGLEYKDLSRLEGSGGSTPVEGGQLDWHGFAADHVRVRHFGPGPTFRDVVRVNLSLGRECWVAYAVWPPLAAGSIEPVEDFLATLAPLEG